MKTTITLFILLLLTSCSEQGIDGLWTIERVSVGDKSMTPNSRWIALAPDNTQVSGNGYLRHSYGNWQYNHGDSTLSIEDINGIKEGFGPFKVDYQNNKMIWTREEDGMMVTVNLARAMDIPAAASDSLIGLWDLNRTIKNGQDISFKFDSTNTKYIHFRWDRNFRQNLTESIGGFGVYQPHGHRMDLQMIDNDGRLNFKYQFNDGNLILSALNGQDMMQYLFERTNAFPESN